MKIDEVVNQYIDLRNQVSAKKKEFDTFKRECEMDMKDLELQILEVSNQTGVDSFKTEFGTAYRSTKTYAKMLDPNSRIEYAKRTGDYGLFTNHISKAHAIELLDEGVDPELIGVDIESESVVLFRKS